MNYPLVSVVMPIKNCEPTFLDNSIKSILNQTLTDLELIVITDFPINESTNKILEKFASDKRLRVLCAKNKGFVEALNYGLTNAYGEYIARMDGDDISLPNRLEVQVRTLKNLNLELVGSWALVINERGNIIGTLNPPTDANSIRKTILLHNPFLHSAMLFKKSVLNRTGMYNSNLYGAEDYDLWLRIISFGFTYSNIPDYLVMLRETKDSVMRGKRWKMTRANYAKVKVLGLTRLGYRDPLSFAFCLAGPFSLLIGPKLASNFKLRLRWLSKNETNTLLRNGPK